jgi:hypothetical protein
MGNTKETTFIQEWEITRTKGIFRHCFKLAVLWGLPMFFIMTFIVQSPKKSILAESTYDTRLIVLNFIIYTVAGFLMGLWIWHSNETKYKKAKGVTNEKETNNVSFSDELRLNSKEACEKAIKHAWIFSLVSTLTVVAFGVIGLFVKNVNVSPIANHFIDPLILLDGALMALLTIFVYKKSRIAITFLLLYFVLSKFMQLTSVGLGWGLGITLLFLFIYANGARAIFLWHSKYIK